MQKKDSRIEVKTYYFEFSEIVVDHNPSIPSQLCCVNGREGDSRLIGYAVQADKIYYIDGNTAYELKNRNKEPGQHFVTDEDKVVLRLKAVLL